MKKIKISYILLLAVFLTGCGNTAQDIVGNASDERLEAVTQEDLGEEYIKTEVIGDISFYVLKNDLDAISVFNPEGEEEMPALVYSEDYQQTYGSYSWGEPGLLVYADRYYLIGTDYVYAAARNVSMGYSIRYGMENNANFFNNIHLEHFSNFVIDGGTEAVYKESENGLLMIADIIFEYESNQYSGKICIYETEDGQSFYLFGDTSGSHFKLEEKEQLISHVNFNTGLSGKVENLYSKESSEILIAGKTYEARFPAVFHIRPQSVSSYQGYTEDGKQYNTSFSASNPYYNFYLEYFSFLSPAANLTPSDVADMMSLYGYEEQEGVMGEDGLIWSKFNITGWLKDISLYYDNCCLYVLLDKGYVYVLSLYYQDDMIDYPVLFEDGIKASKFSLTIDQEQSKTDMKYELSYRTKILGEDFTEVLNSHRENENTEESATEETTQDLETELEWDPETVEEDAPEDSVN